MTDGLTKGSEVKILWICGLFGLLSIVAYGRISTTLSDRAQTQSEMRAPSQAMAPGDVAVPDAPAGNLRTAARATPDPAEVSSTEASAPAAGLSVYLQLHETREVSVLQVSARANLCPG